MKAEATQPQQKGQRPTKRATSTHCRSCSQPPLPSLCELYQRPATRFMRTNSLCFDGPLGLGFSTRIRCVKLDPDPKQHLCSHPLHLTASYFVASPSALIPSSEILGVGASDRRLQRRSLGFVRSYKPPHNTLSFWIKKDFPPVD